MTHEFKKDSSFRSNNHHHKGGWGANWNSQFKKILHHYKKVSTNTVFIYFHLCVSLSLYSCLSSPSSFPTTSNMVISYLKWAELRYTRYSNPCKAQHFRIGPLQVKVLHAEYASKCLVLGCWPDWRPNSGQEAVRWLWNMTFIQCQRSRDDCANINSCKSLLMFFIKQCFRSTFILSASGSCFFISLRIQI